MLLQRLQLLGVEGTVLLLPDEQVSGRPHFGCHNYFNTSPVWSATGVGPSTGLVQSIL